MTSVHTGAIARITAVPRPGSLWRRCFLYWFTAYRRTWRGSAVSGFLAPLLYLGAMGFGLGSLVDSAQTGGVDGVPYVLFVAPGVLAATAMQTAVGESTYPVMGAVKWQRQYHAMLAGPLVVADLVLGHLAFILFRALVASVFFVGVGAALGAFTSVWVLLALPLVVLCAAAHAAPVMAFSARQTNDGAFNLVFRFGVVPMFLFAGTFFPVDQLPAAVRPLAWVTPLWHATSATRSLALGAPDVGAVVLAVGYLSAWTALGIALSVRSLSTRLGT